MGGTKEIMFHHVSCLRLVVSRSRRLRAVVAAAVLFRLQIGGAIHRTSSDNPLLLVARPEDVTAVRIFLLLFGGGGGDGGGYCQVSCCCGCCCLYWPLQLRVERVGVGETRRVGAADANVTNAAAAVPTPGFGGRTIGEFVRPFPRTGHLRG